jgi:hypothetical protein
MNRSVLALAVLALPAASVPLTALAAEPQPGLYEMRMQMLIKGAPTATPVMSFKQCLTADDLKSGNAYRPSEKPEDCTLGKMTISGATVAYDFTCSQDGITMKGRATGKSEASGYSMLMVGSFEPAQQGMSEFRQTLKAKRVGDCKR